MKFKRRRPKEKKEVGWGSPKELQERKTHSRPSNYWRKKYKCKKNKGDHTFVLAPWKRLSSLFMYKCTACGKEEWEYDISKILHFFLYI